MYKETNLQHLSLGIFYSIIRMNKVFKENPNKPKTTTKKKNQPVTTTNPLTLLQHHH